MRRVVIVEDKLKRGIVLAKQFENFSVNHPELELTVDSLLYFKSDMQKAQEELDNIDEKFEIRVIALWNFYKVMNEYYDNEGAPCLIIMDYMLYDDGSEGAGERRVNIMYSKKKKNDGRIWFYTGTGSTNEAMLKQLVGPYVLEVKEATISSIALYLEENAPFMQYLKNTVV